MSTHSTERSSSVAGLAALRDGAAAQGTLLPGTLVGGSIPPHLQYAAAQRRIDALIARHGHDSQQVQAALARWSSILRMTDDKPTSSQQADVTALVDATSSDAPPAPVISTPQWAASPESYEAVLADLHPGPRLHVAVPLHVSDHATQYASVRRFPARRPVGGAR